MRNYIPVILTLSLAMCLTLLPMPEWAIWARPAWVLMVLIFWAMLMPSHVNVGVAWLVGLSMDILTGTLLGEQALASTVVIYLVYRFHRRILMYPMLQQSFSVFIFVLVYQAILYFIQKWSGNLPQSQWYWLSSLTSMLLWPWIMTLMRDYCQWFRVSLAK